MRGSRHYYIAFRMYWYSKQEGIAVPASNKVEAYQKAVYELIPMLKGSQPFSARVSSVTYQNGNVKYFSD